LGKKKKQYAQMIDFRWILHIKHAFFLRAFERRRFGGGFGVKIVCEK
jgi:hypothetical protein